jgi:hypothetical protein
MILGGESCSALSGGSVLFHIYFIALSMVSNGWLISQPNKQEGQITYHSHNNSKSVVTAENCCKVNNGSADLSQGAWLRLGKRW